MDNLTAKAFDKLFDEDKNILAYTERDKAIFRVNVDFPAWAVAELDKEASRLGISRQALIKVWIAEKLDSVRQ